ncbi:uncharacterized protein LOC127727978 isoform X2 [Mytilus californianus]|uniref:uncharacterized protein LOC127727978 isoform X2 n=1 Tax=Mytilus californianus TaxID=6549 RepID=UPI0022468685|nr:uncharacterized protein LOC127727978 isoform X2 [Mytilus californianus]XP_052091082.1 uncharacterized protein LOC127727978 isoform X2 [Mytilus californianus]
MGNCTGKNSKENKRHKMEEEYRPCQSDTVNQNDPGQGVQATQNGIDKNTQNSVEIAKIRKGTSDMKSSVDSKHHGNTEANEQVNMPVKQESVKPEIPKSEVIKSKLQNTETEAKATDANIKEDKQSELNTMDPKVKGSDMNNSAVSPVNDKPDYTEIKDKSYNFAHIGKDSETPDLPESGFLDTKSGKTESAHNNDDIKTDGSDQSHGNDPRDETGGDVSDKKKDKLGHSDLSDFDQNDKGKSNSSEIGKDNSGQPNSAPSDGNNSNQQRTGEEEFAFPTNNECKKDEKGKTDHNEEFKSKTKEKKKKKKDKTDKFVVQPGATVQYHENVGQLFVGCDIGDVKHKKKKEKGGNTKAAIHSFETLNVLTEVAKSVGHIIGPKKSGTCWRVGDDKIITAAHVVVDNIWNQMIKTNFEQDLEKFRVDFEYISKESSSPFKVEPRVLFMNESLDVAVLQLKPDEKKQFPPPLKTFHVLNPEKDEDKQIYLISHNQSKQKEVNSGIGIWKPTEKRLQNLEKFCQQYGEENGYKGLDRKDRLVIKCDFVGGASGSPGIVILDSVAYVVLVYIRGFPSFYHNQQFSEEQKRTFPIDKLFQHGVNIGNLFDTMSTGVYIRLRNEIFPEEALKLEQIKMQHQLAITGDKTSSNTDKTETSIDIVKGKMDNISSKSEMKIPISEGTVCTDQNEDKILDAASYKRLTSHDSVPGQTYITSPVDDTDRYNNTGNQHAQNIETDGKCTVQDPHNHSNRDNGAAENHNLHAREKEIITHQRSPGRTQPVSNDHITIDEWIGHEWQVHRYKQLDDNDLLFLSKAIHPECFNGVALHLDLNLIDVAEIQTKQPTDLCCQMLYKWKNKNGEEATLGKLIQNLFSSWISENKSVEKEELKLAISKVTEVKPF